MAVLIAQFLDEKRGVFYPLPASEIGLFDLPQQRFLFDLCLLLDILDAHLQHFVLLFGECCFFLVAFLQEFEVVDGFEGLVVVMLQGSRADIVVPSLQRTSLHDALYFVDLALLLHGFLLADVHDVEQNR